MSSHYDHPIYLLGRLEERLEALRDAVKRGADKLTLLEMLEGASEHRMFASIAVVEMERAQRERVGAL